MPRLDSKIPLEFHKPDCPNPIARRLGIRDYDKNGNQIWVGCGLICPNCDIIIKQSYQHNPTKKQQDKRRGVPKLPLKILEDTTTATRNQKLSKEENDRRHLKWLKEKKIRQRLRKELDRGKMSRYEMSMRQRVKGLNIMYKNDCKNNKVLKNMIDWDPKLVERFLAVRPTFSEIWEIVSWPPVYRSSNRKANRKRGVIPNPEKNGYYTKYDPGEFVKLVVEEAKGRMEAMEDIIRKHHESKIQVYYTVEAPVPDKKKKKKSLN